MLRDKILSRSNVNMETLLKEEEEVRFELLAVPNDFENLEKLAQILFHKRDCEGAIEIYKKLYKLGKKDESVLGFLGYLNYELGNYTKAIKYFNKFLDKKPQEAFVHFLLGNTYSRIGQIIDATSSYDFAIFLDLDIYKAHLDFAKEYEVLGRFEKALQEYIAAFEIDPRDKSIKKKIEDMKNKIN